MLNEIARVKLSTNKVLIFDKYSENRSCGSFIMIDPITNNTSAVGMIIDRVDDVMGESTAASVHTFVGESAKAQAEELRNKLAKAGESVVVIDIEELSDEMTLKVCEQIVAEQIHAIGVLKG